MINAGTVQVRLFAETKQFVAGMTAASSSMSEFQKSAMKFSKAAIFALGAIGIASAKMATDFDKRLREISTLLIGVTEKAIRNMSREIRDLANVTGKALDDIGKAKYDIISAGFIGVAESIQLLNSATRLAVGGVTSVTNAADLLTSALNSWQQRGTEAEAAADILFTTVRLGKTTMDLLTGSMGRVFPTARTLNASLADVGAAMATITAGGIKTYEAATYLNQAFTKMGAPSDKAAKQMALYGIEVKRTSDGMFDLLNTIKQFVGYDLQQMRRFFPEIRAIKAVLAMSNNMKFLERAIRDTNNAAGASQVAFEKMSQSWSVKLNKSIMKIKDSMVELGDKIMPDVVKAFDWFVNALDVNSESIANTFIPMIKTVGALASMLINLLPLLAKIGFAYLAIAAAMKIATIATAAYTVITKVSLWLTAAYAVASLKAALSLGTMSVATGLATIAMAKLNAVMATNPFILMAMVIIAMGAAYFAFGKKMAVARRETIKMEREFKNSYKGIEDYALALEQLDIDIEIGLKFKEKHGNLPELSVSELLGITEARPKVILPMPEVVAPDLLEPIFYTFKTAIDATGNVAAGLYNVSAGFFEVQTSAKDATKAADEATEAIKAFGVGTIVDDVGLLKFTMLLDNLNAYNASLKEAGLNTFKFNKATFDALGISLKSFEKQTKIFEASGNSITELTAKNTELKKSLTDLEGIEAIKIGSDWVTYANALELLDLEDKTPKEILAWIKEFNEQVAVIETAKINELYNSIKDISDLAGQGMEFKLPMLDDIFEIDLAPLEKATKLLHTYEMSWEDIGKYELFGDEQIKRLKEVFAILEARGFDKEKLAEYFGLLKDITTELETFGDTLASEFARIGDTIASIMANSFTEIILSSRVAMQELEKYNKGITNAFRTQAEIREEAWANMWNNILADTAAAVLEMIIKYGIMAAALVILDALSEGMLSIAMGATSGKGKEAPSGFWKFMGSMFEDAGGSGLANWVLGGSGDSIKDGIITPSGQVIKTAPDDYIMAMKDPTSFGKNVGGDGGIVNNYIYAMDSQSFEDYLRRNPKALASGTINAIQKKNLRLNVVGDRVGAKY